MPSTKPASPLVRVGFALLAVLTPSLAGAQAASGATASPAPVATVAESEAERLAREKAAQETAILITPYALKTVTPLLVSGMAFASGQDPLPALAAAGLVGLAWSLPGGMVIDAALRNDADSLRFWRGTSLAVDLACMAGLAGTGAWLLAHPVGGGSVQDIVGALTIVISLPFAAATIGDLFPFPAEVNGRQR